MMEANRPKATYTLIKPIYTSSEMTYWYYIYLCLMLKKQIEKIYKKHTFILSSTTEPVIGLIPWVC